MRHRIAEGFGLLIIVAIAASFPYDDAALATMPFTPSFDVAVSNANPGVRANTTNVHSVPAGNYLIDSINTFIPIDWQIASGSTYPVGETVGQVIVKADKSCDGSVETLAPGDLLNQALGPDPSRAEWLAIVDGSWQLLFIVDQTTQPREWQIAVTLANASMPSNMCSPEELKVTIFGTSSPSGALVIANPTHAATYTWDDGLLSFGGSQIVFLSDNLVIGTDTDADGWANTVDNCPTVANPDQLNTDGDSSGDACDPDDDNDGFSDVVEISAGTSPLLRCGTDAWPADINNDTFSDISDITALGSTFGKAVPPAPPRYNIAPDPPDGFVDITDISALGAFFGKRCSA